MTYVKNIHNKPVGIILSYLFDFQKKTFSIAARLAAMDSKEIHQMTIKSQPYRSSLPPFWLRLNLTRLPPDHLHARPALLVAKKVSESNPFMAVAVTL